MDASRTPGAGAEEEQNAAVRQWTKGWENRGGRLVGTFRLSRSQISGFLSGLLELEEDTGCFTRTTVAAETVEITVGGFEAARGISEREYLLALRITTLAAQLDILLPGVGPA